ncbi:MAG TPA: type II toxin-antitoxin system CcdA family antitoxin [Acetobacteraceae bacterium]|jgi:antitoxin CcdA
MNEVGRTPPDQQPEAQLSVPSSLLTEAQELGVNVALAAAEGIRRAVTTARAARYAEENREAVDAWNGYVATNGLPFNDIMEHPI